MSTDSTAAVTAPHVHFVLTEHAGVNAPLVVLIHPAGYDLTYWDSQIDALSDTHNVLALDLPGHGRSESNALSFSFEAMAETVSGLISKVSGGRPVHLVGISVGSFIAQHVTLAYPKQVRSLSLIGSAATFNDAARAGMRARADTIEKDGMAAVVESSLQRWFTAQTRDRRPHLVDRVTKTLLADDPAAHAQLWRMIATLDTVSRLHEIACPTLLLVGKEDPSTPPAASELLKQHVKHSDVAVCEGASHIVMLEEPSWVNQQLITFFRRVDAQSTSSTL
jgi:3-oxoadipate enol-lactonase